jgi:signal transduction histidine kinase
LVLNAARHSNVRLIAVNIKTIEKGFISFKDNGSSFGAIACERKKSLELQSAEGRVQYLKGNYTLRSEPGCGTNIHIEIPQQFNNGISSIQLQINILYCRHAKFPYKIFS